jgi:transcriptional regulator GlxA family with amidase domain
MDRRIAAAVRIIHLESDRNLLVRNVAQRVNLSLRHFMYLFKSETSVSPKHYMRALRITKARELLGESFLSIKQVATKVGFGDRSHFSRDFKSEYGQTPSEFRLPPVSVLAAHLLHDRPMASVPAYRIRLLQY